MPVVPKAHEAAKTANLKTRYMDWEERRGDEHYVKGGTPPEQHMFALRAALDMIMAEGLEHVWKRHTVLAGAVREAIGAWATGGSVAFNILEPSERLRRRLGLPRRWGRRPARCANC